MKTRNLLEIGQEIIDEYSKEQWMHGFIRGYCEAYNDEKEIDYRLLRKEAHEAYKVSQWVKNNIND